MSAGVVVQFSTHEDFLREVQRAKPRDNLVRVTVLMKPRADGLPLRRLFVVATYRPLYQDDVIVRLDQYVGESLGQDEAAARVWQEKDKLINALDRQRYSEGWPGFTIAGGIMEFPS